MKKSKTRLEEKILTGVLGVGEKLAEIILLMSNAIALIINVFINEANHYDNWTKGSRGNK